MKFLAQVMLPAAATICMTKRGADRHDVKLGQIQGRQRQVRTDLSTTAPPPRKSPRQLGCEFGGLVVLIHRYEKRPQRDDLFKLMKRLTKTDRAKTRVFPLRKLGLMEMSSKRENESIQDAVYAPCPYCRGTGLIKSPESMSVEIQRRLQSVLKDKRFRKIPIRVVMHPEVLNRLKTEDAVLLTELENEYQHGIDFPRRSGDAL